MYFKDFLFYAGAALVAALFINHYAKLDINFLNRIEYSIVNSGAGESKAIREYSAGPVSAGASGSSDCARMRTSLGDRRTILRGQLSKAKSENDIITARNIENQLSDLDDKERAACR